MRIAIVGSTGYIGARLRRALLDADIECHTISSTTGDFDLRTGLLVEAGLPAEPIEAIVYLSQSPYYRDVPRHAAHVWNVNVVSALKAAAWAKRCGAKRFVYASSGNVYRPGFAAFREEDPLRRDNWYALSKVHAEETLNLYSGEFNVTCARLFAVYGPGQRGKLIPNLVEAVRNRRPVLLQPHPKDASDVSGVKLSLSYVDDAVDVLKRLALADGPRALNVAGAEVRSIREIAGCIGQRLGIAPSFHVERESRDGNFIADRTKLCNGWAVEFRSFSDGLAATLDDLSLT